jgi:hypothetical protein
MADWRDCPNRIWLDVANDIYVVVSDEDYQWALQWKWQITWDRHKRKVYATRSTQEGGYRRIKYYMHKEILARKDILPPTKKHTMGDHGDGESRNCQRYNLSWATPSMNRKTARAPAPKIKTQPIEETF